jgi:hypothetical protein
MDIDKATEGRRMVHTEGEGYSKAWRSDGGWQIPHHLSCHLLQCIDSFVCPSLTKHKHKHLLALMPYGVMLSTVGKVLPTPNVCGLI